MRPVETRADYDPFAWFYNEYWGRDVTAQLWTALERLLLPHVAAGARVLDLCCGTGQIAASLVARGYAVTGLDASAEMLRYARQNAPAAQFVEADARSFDLPPAYAAAVSTFDSLNHVMSLAELADVFRNVRAALQSGGLFFFDVNLERGFRLNWQEHFSVVDADKVCVVNGTYDAAAKIGRYDFTLFRLDGDTWRRSDFSLSERCYTKAELRLALERAGLAFVAAFDAQKDAGLEDHAGRVFILARKDV